MSLLQWRAGFVTGIEAIDLEHRELIGRIRMYQRELSAGEGAVKALEVLSAIYAAIADHFMIEEQFMEQMHHASYAIHKQDHETLLDTLREIIAEVEHDGVLDDVQLTDDLDRWFSDHFHTHDAGLHGPEGP